MDSSPSSVRRRPVCAAREFQLHELVGPGGLRAQLLPSGALFALRQGATLINQLLPGPAEEGLFRLLLRWRDEDGRRGWAPLAGPGIAFSPTDARAACWMIEPLPGLRGETRFELHPELAAWCWRVRLRNATTAPLTLDVLHAQDLGLADEGAVRNNEAYVSHYIDLLPARDESLGWTILARQNQPMAGGRHPWLGVACATGAASFCTDGFQFFGSDHRLTNEPAAIRNAALPSRRLQYEFALAGLQSVPLALAPGAAGEIVFVARFVEDHPTASTPEDVARLGEAISRFVVPPSSENFVRRLRTRSTLSQPPGVGPVSDRPCASRKLAQPFSLADDSVKISPATDSENRALSEGGATNPVSVAPRSVFVTASWLHGDPPTAADWDAWFPGERRHAEHAPDGTLLAFFHGAETHVVARAKEAAIARPHGHILRSGEARWFDATHFGLTCYAAGIFAAQAYLGHPSFARLLSVVRNALNITRGSGQRVFMRHDGAWRQLGVPSAFAMTPGEARWIYRLGATVIEARVRCASDQPAAALELTVQAGAPREFLVTHELALGAAEFDHGGELELHPEAGWLACRPAAASLVGRHQPDLCFAIAAFEPAQVAAIGGDELLYAELPAASGAAAPPPRETELRGEGAAAPANSGPYAVLHIAPVMSCAVILLGTLDGPGALPQAVNAARQRFAHGERAGRPAAAPVRLRNSGEAAVARVDEILPWFAHNAAIHFSAPHGPEQYGGAAWGVRDVCQGSVEWLLAAGEFGIVRRILEEVFSQQYAHDGGWPQWFMFPPYRFIQQAHSHGDVCFWPVKALCDYVEAANDTAFLRAELGYTDAQRFEPCGPRESVLAHCDRVVAQCEARFVRGTALVNYGDGDWDDTLQPVDAAMRTQMVSAWTVGLAYQVLAQLAEVCRRAGELARAQRIADLTATMRRDFAGHLLPGGVVAGFLVAERDGTFRPLLHPDDTVTRIRYRLLPMTRSILAGLFTPEEARRHLDIIAQELRYPDGVRLMSEPARYHGGVARIFQRAETAANVGREIGLMYVHAHLRYAEALAKTGDADGLWHALQVANPVALAAMVPHAMPRQSNVYFSSSDADFADRYEAAERWPELHRGSVPVRGGWRLYSSGPGLFIHKIRACLLGVRESFGDVVFDPVLPRRLDGLAATTTVAGRPAELTFRVKTGTSAPHAITVNGARLTSITREPNPYRPGGLRVPGAELAARLGSEVNRIEIEL